MLPPPKNFVSWGGNQTKTAKDLSTPATLPPPSTARLVAGTSPCYPLGLTGVCTSQGPQLGSMEPQLVQTLLALTMEAEHLNQTLLMRCYVSVKRCEKHC